MRFKMSVEYQFWCGGAERGVSWFLIWGMENINLGPVPLAFLNGLLLILGRQEMPPRRSCRVPSLFIGDPAIEALSLLPGLLSAIPAAMFVTKTSACFLCGGPSRANRGRVTSVSIYNRGGRRMAGGTTQRRSRRMRGDDNEDGLARRVVGCNRDSSSGRPGTNRRCQGGRERLRQERNKVRMGVLPNIKCGRLRHLMSYDTRYRRRTGGRQVSTISVVGMGRLWPLLRGDARRVSPSGRNRCRGGV